MSRAVKLLAVAQNRNPEGIKLAIVQAALAGKSYTQIAKEFDIAKGVVAGIVYRAHKALGRRSPAPRQAAAVSIPKTKPVIVARTPEPTPSVVWQPKAVPYFQISEGQCRWPLWSARTPFSEKSFCGLPARAGAPYCDHCCGLSYSPAYTRDIDRKLNLKAFARRVA